MKNKLGLPCSKLFEVEKKLVNFKLNLIDETYTFNSDIFSFEYLKSLNEFLFGDIHPKEYIRTRELSKLDCDFIDDLLRQLQYQVNTLQKDEIINTITEIWYYQPFIIGNTRTLVAYTKVLNSKYLLDLPINVNGNIESNPRTFKRMMLTKKR